MQINVNAAVLALGIAIGAAGASWVNPAPARAAGPAYEYKVAYAAKPTMLNGFEEPNKQLNDFAISGWEPIEVIGAGGLGPIVYLRRPKS